jgi:hypothetical protein
MLNRAVLPFPEREVGFQCRVSMQSMRAARAMLDLMTLGGELFSQAT